MSQRAWLRSSSLRMRNVMQPEFGTQWCSSARLSANNVSRTERGMVRQRSHSYGRVRPPHLLTGIPFRRSGEDEQRRAPTPTLPVRVSSLEVSCSLSLTHQPSALSHSPAVTEGSDPMTVVSSRYPFLFTRRTQKPLSSLWKVTRSITPEISSVAGLCSGIAAFICRD